MAHWINTCSPPVVIGGIGGSGTRLLAQCLTHLTFYIGSDLNDAYDNLWFTLLFKRVDMLSASEADCDELIEIFLKGMTGRKAFTTSQIALIHSLTVKNRMMHRKALTRSLPLKNRIMYRKTWLKKRARTLLSVNHRLGAHEAWGWKEPNSHIVLDRLQRALPTMKYIHVTRNGLDMAYSPNQSQLKLWGSHFLGAGYEITPYYALKYWTVVHRRVLELGQSMGSRFLFLNYDKLCTDPVAGMKKVVDILGLDVAESQIRALSMLVTVPPTLNRFKQHDVAIFDAEDMDFVRQLGFETRLD